MDALKETNFQFLGQTGFYRGKVRDVYYFGNKLAIVATDRISAFDVVLPRAIPYKGQVLNQIAAYHLKATSDIVPNWVLSQPDPNVAIGHFCEPFKVEMVIRGYLAGHAWRVYQSGERMLCGVQLPDGLKGRLDQVAGMMFCDPYFAIGLINRYDRQCFQPVGDSAGPLIGNGNQVPFTSIVFQQIVLNGIFFSEKSLHVFRI